MTTKDQERKALAQIRKIVEGLGADSYVGTAFEGCFEIAEENIDNDWGCSMKQRVEMNEREAEAAEKTIQELQKANSALTKRAEEAERLFTLKTEAANGYYCQMREMADEAIKNHKNYLEEVKKVEALQMEVIKLKARLFDMMEAQGA